MGKTEYLFMQMLAHINMKNLQIIILLLLANNFCFSQETLTKITPIRPKKIEKLTVRNGFSGERLYAIPIKPNDLKNEFSFHMNFYYWMHPDMWIRINQNGVAIVGFHDLWNSKDSLINEKFFLDESEMGKLKTILLDYHFMITDGTYHPINCDTCPSVTVSDGWDIYGSLYVNGENYRNYEYSMSNIKEKHNKRLSFYIIGLLKDNVKSKSIKELVREYKLEFIRMTQ